MAEATNTTQDLSFEVYKILIPPEYLQDFLVSKVEDKPDSWQITLVEKEENLPAELKGQECVLDGYCNPIDILSHAFSMKKIYLRLYRRRWKIKGDTKHFSNDYDLHPKGMKTTRLFRDFFKDAFGATPD